MHFTNWVSNNIFYITLIRSHSPPIISPLFDFFDAQSIWTDLEYLIAIIIKILVLILRMNKIFVLSVANCLFLNIEQKPPKLINDQAVWEKSRKREIEKKKKEYDYEDREMMKQILDCSRFLMLKMNGHETRASLLFAAIRESSHDFETLQFSFPSSLLVLSFDLSDMCCCSNSNCKWITVTMIIVLKKRMIWWHQCFNDG